MESRKSRAQMQSSLPPRVVECVPVNKQPPSSGGERTPFGESVREKGFERELPGPGWFTGLGSSYYELGNN